MNIDNFNLGKWRDILKPFIESEKCDKIYQHLKNRSRAGHKILPLSNDTFKAFQLTDPDNIKAVMVGLSPYHTLDKFKNPYADGLLFSNSISKDIAPSLRLFYNALEKDCKEKADRSGDLYYLAEQGVLLLNASLTCELNKATIHNDIGLWDEFNKFLFKEVFASWCGIPFLLIGKEAGKLNNYLFSPMCHLTKTIEHPAFAARNNREWNNENCFNWINDNIEKNNGKEFKIQWNIQEWLPF